MNREQRAVANQREQLPAEDRLLKPAVVAAKFGVDAKTITRWAQAGKLTAIRTLGGKNGAGGHRRYRESDVNRLLAERTDWAVTE